MPATSSSVAMHTAAFVPAESVTLMLDTNVRVRNRFGEDFFAKLLDMRLAGMNVTQIAAALKCSDDIVTETLKGWRTQVELTQAPGWTPPGRTPRARSSQAPRKKNS